MCVCVLGCEMETPRRSRGSVRRQAPADPLQAKLQEVLPYDLLLDTFIAVHSEFDSPHLRKEKNIHDFVTQRKPFGSCMMERRVAARISMGGGMDMSTGMGESMDMSMRVFVDTHFHAHALARVQTRRASRLSRSWL